MKGRGGKPPGSGRSGPTGKRGLRSGPPKSGGSRSGAPRSGGPAKRGPASFGDKERGEPRFRRDGDRPQPRFRRDDDRPAPRPRRDDRPAERSRDEDRRPRPGRAPREADQEFRSFDGSPRRRRDSEWDVSEPGWSPEQDLDIAGLSEPGSYRGRDDDEGPRRRDRDDAPRASRPRSERPARAPREDRDEPRRPAPPAGPTRAQLKAAATETLQTGVQTLTVTEDEDDMRVDRFLAARFPQLSFSYIQRIVRKGELRVNGKRVETKDRLEPGQAVRVPPLKIEAQRPMSTKVGEDVRGFLASITLYEDQDVLVLAKPAGLAVQGGSGTKKHLDGMLAALTDEDGQRPRLVHRLDKDTSGCILVAKTRFAASALAKTFRTRAARKIYWAVVAGVPKPRQGRISTYLAKEEREDESFMRIAKHGEQGASHAVSYYAVIETMAQKLAWLSLKPVTGRTHQLRVHAAEIGHPILGDPKYFRIENWEIPGGLQDKLHLHARRLVVPHPRGKGTIDVSAPLPPHMEQTFNLMGWDIGRYDPIVEAPEE